MISTDSHMAHTFNTKKRLLISALDPALVEIKAIRSSGAGGQNVNKRDTQIQISFDVAQSTSLSSEQKEVILRAGATENEDLKRLRNKINKSGILIVSSQEHKTQERNKEAAFVKLNEMIVKALATPKPRTEGLTKKAKGRIEAQKKQAKLMNFKKRKEGR